MYLDKFRYLLVVILCFAFIAGGVLSAQDLNQQKQVLIQKIHEIDTKLKDNPTKDEYDNLLKDRKKIQDEIKSINEKLMADADAMKKINAVKKAYNDGLNAYKLGQLQTAVANYNKAIELDPTFGKAYYGKGLALKKMRKYKDAIQAYKSAVEHSPNYVEAYIALGKMYSQINQPDYAISTYNSAIQNDPSAYKAYYELGAVYLNKKKNYNKAAANFTKATQIKPDYDLAYYSLGVSLIELGRLNEAVLAMENALSVTKKRKWAAPYYRMAVIYNKQGKYSKAKVAAQKALANKKNYAPAAYEAGKASKDLGQFNKALSYFQIAAKDRLWKRSADYEIDLIQNRDKYGGK